MGGKATAGNSCELGSSILLEEQSLSMKKSRSKTNQSILSLQEMRDRMREMRRLKSCLSAMSKHDLGLGNEAQPRCPCCLLHLQGCLSLMCLSRKQLSPGLRWRTGSYSKSDSLQALPHGHHRQGGMGDLKKTVKTVSETNAFCTSSCLHVRLLLFAVHSCATALQAGSYKLP